LAARIHMVMIIYQLKSNRCVYK